MIALTVLERDAVIVACAISAGIHAALAPDHFAEGTGAGLGFLGSAIVLAALVVALTRWPDGTAAVVGVVVVLAGLIGSYALATTTGLPLFHPDPEPVDGLALCTKAIEVVGLLAAASLLRRGRPAPAPALSRMEGTLT